MKTGKEAALLGRPCNSAFNLSSIAFYKIRITFASGIDTFYFLLAFESRILSGLALLRFLELPGDEMLCFIKNILL